MSLEARGRSKMHQSLLERFTFGVAMTAGAHTAIFKGEKQ